MIAAPLTELGTRNPYVAALKRAILAIAPNTQLVDLTSRVTCYSVREAAYDSFVSCCYYPPQTSVYGTADSSLSVRGRFIVPEYGANADLNYRVGPEPERGG